MSRLRRSLPLVLAAVLAAGCSDGDSTGQATTSENTNPTESAGKITLLGAGTNSGPWVRSLSLEHGADGVPVSFYVCAAWDEATLPTGCDAASGTKLPTGTILRLEQRPPGSAVSNADSPGWGTVGISDQTELDVPLSDFVSGLDVRTATYRVTLRRLEGGPAVATSNTITVTWAQ